ERRDRPDREHDRRQAGDPRVEFDKTGGGPPPGDLLHDPGSGARNLRGPAQRGCSRMKRTPMTLRGAEALRTELRKLKSEDRPNIIKAIAEARGHGELSGNAEYHTARE